MNPLRWIITGVLLGRDKDGNTYEIGHTAQNTADPNTQWVITSDGEKHQGYSPNDLN